MACWNYFFVFLNSPLASKKTFPFQFVAFEKNMRWMGRREENYENSSYLSPTRAPLESSHFFINIIRMFFKVNVCQMNSLSILGKCEGEQIESYRMFHPLKKSKSRITIAWYTRLLIIWFQILWDSFVVKEIWMLIYSIADSRIFGRRQEIELIWTTKKIFHAISTVFHTVKSLKFILSASK